MLTGRGGGERGRTGEYGDREEEQGKDSNCRDQKTT